MFHKALLILSLNFLACSTVEKTTPPVSGKLSCGSPPKVGAPGVSVSRNRLLLLNDNC